MPPMSQPILLKRNMFLGQVMGQSCAINHSSVSDGDASNAILRKNGVISNNDRPLSQRLREDKVIKWITMVQRHRLQNAKMHRLKIKQRHALIRCRLHDGYAAVCHLADPVLDRNFPRSGYADQYLVVRISYHCAGTAPEPWIVLKPPQQHMRVE